MSCKFPRASVSCLRRGCSFSRPLRIRARRDRQDLQGSGRGDRRLRIPCPAAWAASCRGVPQHGGDALVDRIRQGHGHCDNIASYYNRFGGIRSWLRTAVDAAKLSEADNLFLRLSTADGDLFAQLGTIGDTLQNEATAIVNLLVSGQEDEARPRTLLLRSRLYDQRFSC